MMEAPQIITIGLIAAGIGVSLAKHGESKGEFGIADWLISPAISVAILYWGGFWG